MRSHGRYVKLLEPLKVKQVTFRNRMVKAATTLGFAAADGNASPMLIEFYEGVARGGVGLLIVESSCVDFPVGGKGENRLRIDEDRFIPSFSRLADAIRRHGCPTFLQATHNGPAGTFSGLQPLVPSVLSEAENPVADPRMSYDPPRAMSRSDIEQVVEKHARAAWRAKQAGFDGVEFHAGHCYLLASFLSRVWNRRDDDYGCQSLENRSRIVVDIIRAARALVGPDFVLGVRMNGQEWGHEKGTTVEESVGLAKILESAGLDIVNVTNWGYGKGDFAWAQYAEQFHFPERTVPAELLERPGIVASRAAIIKSAVSIPVIAVGSIDPALGEWILSHGKADAVAMGRRLLADPDLPRKIAEGHAEDIRPCMQGLECRSEFKRYTPNQCRVNAALGKEGEYKITPVARKKRVVVVGGGPSGMEAARVAASRGHDVILYERRARLGGALHVAALIKGTKIENLPALVRYFEVQLQKLNVRVKLKSEFTVSEARELMPDAVIVATGGRSAIPDIPGINRSNVLTGDVLAHRAIPLLHLFGADVMARLTQIWLPVGRHVAIIGGQLHGCQLAAFLVKRRRQVTIIEESENVGEGISIVMKERLINWLTGKGVIILKQVQVSEISDRGLVVRTSSGDKQTIGIDTVIVTLPTQPNLELFKALECVVPEIYAVGDCNEPRLILGAIASGARAGHRV